MVLAEILFTGAVAIRIAGDAALYMAVGCVLASALKQLRRRRSAVSVDGEVEMDSSLHCQLAI